MKLAGIVAKHLGGILVHLFRVYYATLRLRILLPDGAVVQPALYPLGREFFALCERDSLALAGLVAKARFTVLVARGRDGDWASAVLERLGCRVVRGSSLGGGAQALKEIFYAARGSVGPAAAAIVVDGPLGPPGQAKGGVILCGIYTGSPVRAVGAATVRRLTFHRSWSKIYLPLPFSPITIAVDDPLPGLEAARVDDVDDLADLLTQRLAVMRGRAMTALRRSRDMRWGGGNRATALDHAQE